MPATAADIPIELHDLILDFFTLEDWEGQLGRNHVMISKHDLSCCALVCRTWAAICQKKIFKNITLRSSEDVYELLSLASHLSSQAFRHTDHLRLATTVSLKPWIHLVSLKLLPTLNLPRVVVALALDGPGELGMSIHGAYPRASSQLSERIYHLELSSVHFKRCMDLVRLTAEMPSLWNLYCKKVTWVEPIQPRACLSPVIRCHTKDGAYVSMTECTDNTAVMWIASRHLPPGMPRLCEDDAYAVYHIALSLTQDLDPVRFPTTKVAYALRFYSQPMGLLQSTLTLTHEDRPILPRINFKYTRRAHSQESQVEVIVVRFAASDLPIDEMLNYKWAAFDEHASSLSELRIVLLVFVNQGDLTRFARAVAEPSMTRLLSSAKLKYVIPDGGTHWYFSIPDADDEYLRTVKSVERFEALYS